MKKEEAIQLLKSLLLNIAGEKDYQAIELAITALQSDPETPDWSQAPEWANYYAIDGDGSRWFYEFEPFQEGLDFNQNKGQWMNDDDSRRMKLFKRPEQ